MNTEQRQVYEQQEKYNIILKSRQLGISTYILCYALFLAMQPNTSSLILSYKTDSADALFFRLKFIYDNLPHKRFKFPQIKRSNKNEFLLDNGSRITSTVAGSKDVGRGDTYSGLIHLSEFGFYLDQKRILTSCEQALAKNDNAKIFIESTAEKYDEFAMLYKRAEKGESKYKAFFFPFYCDATKKQFVTEIKEAEVWYKSWNPLYKGRNLAVADLEPDEKILHEQGCTLALLMWRKWKLQDMDISEFRREYPSNSQECFIYGSGKAVFNQEKIVNRLPHILPPMQQTEYPNELKPYKKGLFLFHLPKAGEKYYLGIDVSGGTGNDYSTIFGINQDGENVLSYNNNTLSVFDFAELIDVVGRFYNYAFLVPERNANGLPLIERLRREKEYMNIYKQKIFNQYGKRMMQLGWLTSQVSKNIMVQDYKEYFEKGMINVNCKETLTQMQTFIESAGGKTGNKKGAEFNDDLVVAAMLAVQGIKANKWYVL